LGIVEQNLLISGLVFLATLVAMSSGYALLRKNLSEAARALRADHSHRSTGQTAGDSYDHRPNAAELHPYPIWITSHDRRVTWGNKTALKNPFRAVFSFGKNRCCHMTPGTKCAEQS
jgi:hypothetical protein